MGQYYLLLLRTQTQTQTCFMLYEIKAFCSHLSFLDHSLYNSRRFVKRLLTQIWAANRGTLNFFLFIFFIYLFLFRNWVSHHLLRKTTTCANSGEGMDV